MAWLEGFFGTHEAVEASPHATALDVITYVASLVSNPAEIDPMLDKVREISSNLQPGQPPTAANEKTLAQVYIQIESYLSKKERIRKFSPEEIRQRVQAKFPEIASRVINLSQP